VKYYLTKELAHFIKRHKGWINVSFDLGMEENIYSAEELKAKLPLDEIKGEWVYIYDDQTRSLERLALFTDHLYRVRVINGFPILEIDGVRMNLLKEVNPVEYARRVVEGLKVRRGMDVLECCMGLGYITAELVRRGARVWAVEKRREVVELSRATPWFSHLHSHERVKVVNKPIEEFVEEAREEGLRFHRIVHDPPSPRMAGELYSRKLYRAYRDVVREKGMLYHYSGLPGQQRGWDEVERTARRLEEAGWRVVRKDRLLKGVFAVPAPSPRAGARPPGKGGKG